jgi:hypothetical protein
LGFGKLSAVLVTMSAGSERRGPRIPTGQSPRPSSHLNEFASEADDFQGPDEPDFAARRHDDLATSAAGDFVLGDPDRDSPDEIIHFVSTPFAAMPLRSAPADLTNDLPAGSFSGPTARRRLMRYAVLLVAVVAAIGVGAYVISNRTMSVGIDQTALPAAPTLDGVAANAALLPAPAPARQNEPADSGDAPSGGAASTSLTPAAVATRATEPQRASLAAPNVSGTWTLDTRVESSGRRDVEGLQHSFRLELQQTGGRITGRGVLTSENGGPPTTSAHTSLFVRGSIHGTRLTLSFTERGDRDPVDGKMILDVHDDGVMRGRFSSAATRSTGPAEARRPPG